MDTSLNLTKPLGTTSLYNVANISMPNREYELELLQSASDEKALLYLPVIVFMAILMAIGVFGNIIVVYIYCFRFPSRSANCFFITMAIFDLLASAIGMPIDIYDLRNHYTFYSTVICKLFRYVENVTTYGSAIILVEIAFDRYLKICRPLEFGFMSRCRIMCIVAVLIAIAISTPSLFLFGITHKELKVEGLNVTGNDCSVADEYSGSVFEKLFYGILILIFITTFVLLAGFYIRIWVEIKRRKEITIGDKINRSNTETKTAKPILKKQQSLPSESEDESSVFTNKQPRAYPKSNIPSTKSRSLTGQSKMASISEAVSRMRVSRTTKIFIAVTLVFVLSYLPSIAAMMLRILIKRLRNSASSEEELFLKLFSRFHYINNSANPIIYSFLNINFRRQCSKLLKSIVFCCRSSLLERKPSSSSGSSANNRRDRAHKIEVHSLE